MKVFAVASLLAAASAYEISGDQLLSGACHTCQEQDQMGNMPLCAGNALPICARPEMMTPGYCGPCEGYYEMHEGNDDRDECHFRMARFTESDFCVNLRVTEAREKRAAQDELDRIEEEERRDDKEKARAAKAAQEAADAAHEAAAEADALAAEAEAAAMETERLQDEAQDAKQDAKDAARIADEEKRIAEEHAAMRNEERLAAIAISDMANAAYEAAQEHEAATAAALVAAQMHAQALQAEADRLQAIADRS